MYSIIIKNIQDVEPTWAINAKSIYWNMVNININYLEPLGALQNYINNPGAAMSILSGEITNNKNPCENRQSGNPTWFRNYKKEYARWTREGSGKTIKINKWHAYPGSYNDFICIHQVCVFSCLLEHAI